MKKLVTFTWQDFESTVDELVVQLKRYPKFGGIYGVPRGGLVLAVVLSHRLGIPFRDAVTDNTLVVDDISETGHTLVPYQSNFIATLHYVEGSIVKPNVFIHHKDENIWIVYPWETRASSKGG